MASSASVEAWLEAQNQPTREMIEALRAAVRAAAPDLAEDIKWNAPSFADGDQDRVTLGVERRGGVRLVLHRGARSPQGSFQFDDPARLARWPATDRGVVVFRDPQDIEAKRAALEDLVRRWIAATA